MQFKKMTFVTVRGDSEGQRGASSQKMFLFITYIGSKCDIQKGLKNNNSTISAGVPNQVY